MNSAAKDKGDVVGLFPREIVRGFSFPTFPLINLVGIDDFK